jgi:hypothetical protein
MRLTYTIDGRPFAVDSGPESAFFAGEDVCLAERFDDPTAGQAWYREGYAILDASPFFGFREVRADVERVVKGFIAEAEPDADLSRFRLDDYHKYVSGALHHDIIRQTRRLFPADFGFDEAQVVARLSELLGISLGYRNPLSGDEQWIIARINPPGSIGFNPAHKDVYEAFDRFGSIPRMVNVWIPICGVGGGTGLPVAPGSHLVRESAVRRTRAGSVMEGQSYSVNCIESWGGETAMTTLCPREGEMIVFSSYLIHGLARNHHPDTTRVSLEFRLYEQ